MMNTKNNLPFSVVFTTGLLFIIAIMDGTTTVHASDYTCKARSGSCDECTGNVVGTVTHNGNAYCSNQAITSTDNGIKKPDGFVLPYGIVDSCDSPCQIDMDSDSDDSEDSGDEAEEGDEVCYSSDDDKCCADSSTTIDAPDGRTYCVKFPGSTEVDNGIKYTYPSGKTNTKFWINIYPCDPNSRGLCHYDESDDGPLAQVAIVDDGSKGSSNDNTSVETLGDEMNNEGSGADTSVGPPEQEGTGETVGEEMINEDSISASFVGTGRTVIVAIAVVATITAVL